WRHVREGVVAHFIRATRDLQVDGLPGPLRMCIDEALDEIGPLRNRMRVGQANAFERTSETFKMRLQPEWLSGIYRDDLIDPVSKQEAPVERRNPRLLARHEAAIQVAGAHVILTDS